MNRFIAILVYLFVGAPTLLFGQSASLFDRYISVDSVRSVVDGLMEELSDSHPGYYRYTTPDDFERLISGRLDLVEEDINLLELYRLMKPLIAQIGCLHTGIYLSEDMEEILSDSLKYLPFEVKTDGNSKAIIKMVYGKGNELEVGDEIISIDRKPIAEILSHLKLNIPSDGYNETLKVQLLNRQFASWHQTMLSSSNQSEIEILRDESINNLLVSHIDDAHFPSYESLMRREQPQLSFEITDENIGILTVRSFAKSRVKAQNQNFKKYIAEVFKEIQAKEVTQLLIDVRDNSGGTDGNAVDLASYFHTQEFRYWNRIEVTENIAGQIKGINRLFYPKPDLVDSTYHWKGALFSGEFDYYHPVSPAKHPFKGEVYILTNGLCMSSCSDFVANLHHNQKAVVIGEETGGGYQGNTSGMMPEAEVIPGLLVTVPLQKYTNAVDEHKWIGSGTIPDYILDIFQSEEVWLEKSLEIIRNEK